MRHTWEQVSLKLQQLERDRKATVPRFAAQLESHGRALVPLLVASGRVSAVDLCELALASHGFADGARPPAPAPGPGRRH
jgi:hypothetical protein